MQVPALMDRHPAVPLVADTYEVRKSINAVRLDKYSIGRKIAVIATEIAEVELTREKGWQSHLAALRANKAQLEAEQAQLQEGEQSLLAELSLLLRRNIVS